MKAKKSARNPNTAAGICAPLRFNLYVTRYFQLPVRQPNKCTMRWSPGRQIPQAGVKELQQAGNFDPVPPCAIPQIKHFQVFSSVPKLHRHACVENKQQIDQPFSYFAAS
jgi:hypothetical protein